VTIPTVTPAASKPSARTIQPHGVLLSDDAGATATDSLGPVSVGDVLSEGVGGEAAVSVSTTVVVATSVVVSGPVVPVGVGRVGSVGICGTVGIVGTVTSGRVAVTSGNAPLGIAPETPGEPFPLPQPPRR
jgi:hypothetical protein